MHHRTFSADTFREQSEQFIETLARLTRLGRAEWVATSGDPGIAYCFTRREQIVFNIHAGDPPDVREPTDAADIHGVGAKYRNVGLLWLPSSCAWDTLVALLINVPKDNDRYRELSREVKASLFDSILGSSEESESL
jgi:hypothetical protein